MAGRCRHRLVIGGLLSLTAEHGLHEGDVLVLTGWAAGMSSLLGLLVLRRR